MSQSPHETKTNFNNRKKPDRPLPHRILDNHGTYLATNLKIWALVAIFYISLFSNPLFFSIFIIGMVLVTEGLLAKLKKGSDLQVAWTLDSKLLTLSLIVIALALPLVYRFNADDTGIFYYGAAHVTYVLYLLSRTDQLLKGQLSDWLVWDLVRGLLTYPFRQLFAGPAMFVSKRKANQNAIQWPSIGLVLLSLFFTLPILLMVASRLALLSSHFDAFYQYLWHLVAAIPLDLSILSDLFWRAIWAFPITLYLFGLIVSATTGLDRQIQVSQWQARLGRYQVFPSLAIYLLLGGLALVYLIFALVNLSQVPQLLGQSLSAAQASQVAVPAFWLMVQVALINLMSIFVTQNLAQPRLLQTSIYQWLVRILYGITLVFSCLAAYKLVGLYILGYGLTPLRLLSAWFVGLVLVFVSLLLVEQFRPLPAWTWAIRYAYISLILVTIIHTLL